MVQPADLERDSNATITQGLLRLKGDRWLRRKQLRRRGEKTRRSRLSIFGKVQRKDDEGGFVRNLGLIGKLPGGRWFKSNPRHQAKQPLREDGLEILKRFFLCPSSFVGLVGAGPTNGSGVDALFSIEL